MKINHCYLFMTDLHYVDLFTLHMFERFRQNLEIGAGVALGEFVACNGLEM